MSTLEAGCVGALIAWLPTLLVLGIMVLPELRPIRQEQRRIAGANRRRDHVQRGLNPITVRFTDTEVED